MEDYIVIVIIVVLGVCLLGIALFTYFYADRMKSESDKKLQYVVDQVNNSQFYSYNFDKQQEQNIKNIDDTVKTAQDTLSKVQNMYKEVVTKTELKADVSTSNVSTGSLKLGNKFSLSGVGDANGKDDEWLRLMGSDNKKYFGGFATSKLWVDSDTTMKGTVTIDGANSEHNNGRDTRTQFNSGGKNFVRGDTDLVGNTRNIGNLHVGKNLNVTDRIYFSDAGMTTTSGWNNNTDPYYMQKVQPATNASSLRLTINDDADESFQIWGDSCGAGDCSGPGTMKHHFQANGDAEHVGRLKASKVQLGDKFSLSGVGDAHNDDEWLRLFNTQGSDFGPYGFAAGKLWTRDLINASDLRLKENVKGLTEEELGKLAELEPKSYNFKNDEKKENRYGFIAQDVEKLYPSMVTQGPNGYLALNYNDFVPLIVGKMNKMDQNINTQDVKSSTVSTKKLCLDDICLTKDDIAMFFSSRPQTLEPSDSNVPYLATAPNSNV
jgi:hypothetical protein